MGGGFLRFIKFSSSSFLWKKNKKKRNFSSYYSLEGGDFWDLSKILLLPLSSGRRKKEKNFLSSYYSLEEGGLLRFIKYSFSSSFLRKKKNKKRNFFLLPILWRGGGSFEIYQIFFFFFFLPE